jgi:uncharacterized protein YutE (UPF0331/DUF86 family)
VPATVGETFASLAASAAIDGALPSRLRSTVGFRNIAVYHCEAIDRAIVFELAGDPLSDFEQFAAAVSALKQRLQNAAMPVMARPRIKACTSCVPS